MKSLKRCKHPHFCFSFLLFSFPMLPRRTSPSPRRKRNHERIPPEIVVAKNQMRTPMAMNISPQMEQRVAAVLGPWNAVRILQEGKKMNNVVRIPNQ